mgnify:CR=1 FL=1
MSLGHCFAITPGTHASLYAILTQLSEPGQVLLCETLTYPGIRAIAARLDLRLVGVASDQDGMCPQALEQETTLRAGDLTMDLISRRVTRAGQEIDLLPREFALLEHLLRRKGRVQTRTMLLEAVWDISFDPMTNVVETHISRLRAKVDRPFDSELIQTVRGAGYRIDT